MEKLQNEKTDIGNKSVESGADDNPEETKMDHLPDEVLKKIASKKGKKMDEQEELEEGGAAMRQGNEDKDQGRERMLPDRIKRRRD